MEIDVIQNKIYEIRGRRVMLDFDLAMLYEVTTKQLKQAVRRNMERFPEDFMFELSKEEFENLRSQIVTSSWGGSRYLPYAFTEQGVSMISSVLRSQKAIQMNIAIMRAFVAMRALIQTSQEIKELARENKELRDFIEEFISETEGKFDDVYMVLAELLAKRPQENKVINPIGYTTSWNQEQ